MHQLKSKKILTLFLRYKRKEFAIPALPAL